MSRPQPLVVLSPERIREIAAPILVEHLKAYGPGALEIWEEQDFDGAYSVSIQIEVDRKVEARDLIDANHELYLAFDAEGDRRFVYLSTEYGNMNDLAEQRDKATSS